MCQVAVCICLLVKRLEFMGCLKRSLGAASDLEHEKSQGRGFSQVWCQYARSNLIWEEPWRPLAATTSQPLPRNVVYAQGQA